MCVVYEFCTGVSNCRLVSAAETHLPSCPAYRGSSRICLSSLCFLASPLSFTGTTSDDNKKSGGTIHRSLEMEIQRDCWLPPVSKAHGRLGAMSGAIHTGKTGQIISGRIVYQAAILGSHENVVRQVEIGSAAIDEGGPSL